VDTATTALGLARNAVVSVLPGLAYHLFSANSDGPAKLGITLARAMNTVDCYLAQLGQAPGSIATDSLAITPVSTPFYEACALLCLALASRLRSSMLAHPSRGPNACALPGSSLRLPAPDPDSPPQPKPLRTSRRYVASFVAPSLLRRTNNPPLRTP
jgi:hypothetical protein